MDYKNIRFSLPSFKTVWGSHIHSTVHQPLECRSTQHTCNIHAAIHKYIRARCTHSYTHAFHDTLKTSAMLLQSNAHRTTTNIKEMNGHKCKWVSEWVCYYWSGSFLLGWVEIYRLKIFLDTMKYGKSQFTASGKMKMKFSVFLKESAKCSRERSKCCKFLHLSF